VSTLGRRKDRIVPIVAGWPEPQQSEVNHLVPGARGLLTQTDPVQTAYQCRSANTHD